MRQAFEELILEISEELDRPQGVDAKETKEQKGRREGMREMKKIMLSRIQEAWAEGEASLCLDIESGEGNEVVNGQIDSLEMMYVFLRYCVERNLAFVLKSSQTNPFEFYHEKKTPDDFKAFIQNVAQAQAQAQG